jgi:glycosyltransferase involved in cell wall biosynthesis
MKISIVSYGHIDSITAIAKYLSLRGNIVSLYLVVYDQEYVNSISQLDLRNTKYGIHTFNEFTNQSNDLNNLVDYTQVVSEFSVIKLPSRSLKEIKNYRYIKQLTNKIKSTQPDIVHFNGDSGHQLLFYFLLRKFAKVLTIHDYHPHTGESSGFHRIKNYFFRKIHYSLNYTFILHSRESKEMLLNDQRVSSEKVHFTYFAPFDFYNYYKNENQLEEFPSAIFFGRISPYKGLKYFCQAIEMVIKKIPTSRFYILGNGDFDFDIEYYKKNYPIEVINSHIDNQTLADYITKSSLAVLPYTDAAQSGVVLTSYAFNKPVIASNVGGIPEVVIEGKTGYLVEPKNPEQLAEIIIYLFTNKDKLNYIKERIMSLKNDKVNRFMNWEKIAEETESIYQIAIKLHK